MNKAGFIGYGHMGSILLKSLLKTEAIQPSQVIISTQTKAKLDELKAMYPDIEIAENNIEVAQKSSTLFLCVGTYQVKPVLMEIRDVLHSRLHLVIISGGLEITSVEREFDGPISKIMPTLIAEVQEGVTLVCHNSKVSPAEKACLVEILSKIGEVKNIAEPLFEVGADFTSCAPGLLASICDQFARAGVKQADFTYEEASEMLLHTLFGTAKLLLQNKEDFQTLTRRVATKGGATEGGVAVLEANLPNVFEKVFEATLERHEARKQKTREQFAKTAT
jgi:pyrroline-5-carboxylate reductase